MISKTAAIRVARSETHMHRRGDEWALSQYSARYGAWVVVSTDDYYKIREAKRRAIVARSLELLGWSAEDAEIEAETPNGSVEYQVGLVHRHGQNI